MVGFALSSPTLSAADAERVGQTQLRRAPSLPYFEEPTVERIRVLPHHPHPPGLWMQRIQQYVERVRHDCRRHFEERRFPALQPAVPRDPGDRKIDRPGVWQGTHIDAPYLYIVRCL